MTMTLYSYFRSSCSYRVRIGMNLKGLDYAIRPIHLVKNGGEQFQNSFAKLNPSGKVPVLIHNETPIFQSVAIFEYLEEAFPETPLYPSTSLEKAKMRQMVELVNSDIQPLQNIRVLKYLVKSCELNNGQKEDWIRYWIEDGFQGLEKMVAKTSQKGNFSYGDNPSVMDCFLIPQVYNAKRFGVDMSKYPTLDRIDRHCADLPAFKKAHPDQQPDAPQE